MSSSSHIVKRRPVMCFILLLRVWVSPLFPPKDGGKSDTAATKDTGFQRDLLVCSPPLPPHAVEAEYIHYSPPISPRGTSLPMVEGLSMSGRQESEVTTFPQLGISMSTVQVLPCTLHLQSTLAVSYRSQRSLVL